MNNVRWYSPLNLGNQTIESTTMELDERLVNLEIKLASQDDLLRSGGELLFGGSAQTASG